MPLPCLIAIDIDGTLLGSDGRVSDRNRDALFAAERAGIQVVIATGRRHAYAMRVLRELGLRDESAMVSSNGTVIRTLGSTLVRRQHLPLETVRWLCREIEDFRDTFVLTFDSVDETGADQRGALVCERSNVLHTSIGRWMEANETSIRHVDRIDELLPAQAPAGTGTTTAVLDRDMDPADGDAPAAPIQAMLCGTVARMEAAYARLAAHPAIVGTDEEPREGSELMLHRTVYPDRDLAILDILPAGCSKASALEYLARERGCTLTDILAIGDNWNDVPMLKAAGKAVLMGNAPAELQEQAEANGWTIGLTNDQDGVAEAIYAVLATEPRV